MTVPFNDYTEALLRDIRRQAQERDRLTSARADLAAAIAAVRRASYQLDSEIVMVAVEIIEQGDELLGRVLGYVDENADLRSRVGE